MAAPALATLISIATLHMRLTMVELSQMKWVPTWKKWCSGDSEINQKEQEIPFGRPGILLCLLGSHAWPPLQSSKCWPQSELWHSLAFLSLSKGRHFPTLNTRRWRTWTLSQKRTSPTVLSGVGIEISRAWCLTKSNIFPEHGTQPAPQICYLYYSAGNKHSTVLLYWLQAKAPEIRLSRSTFIPQAYDGHCNCSNKHSALNEDYTKVQKSVYNDICLSFLVINRITKLYCERPYFNQITLPMLQLPLYAELQHLLGAKYKAI